MSELATIRFEFERTRRLGDRSLAQLEVGDWHTRSDDEANSIAIIVQHMHGNMLSRWTEFLTSDGEKTFRDRDGEFEDQHRSPEALRALWAEGWTCCLDAIGALDDGDLDKTITIRSEPLTVREALLRQLSHYSYHVGQLVLLARAARGKEFQSLTIPRGQSKQHTKGTYKRPPGS
ncbi:MAG: DUF1572 family protein [Planctomycetota bacterium]